MAEIQLVFAVFFSFLRLLLDATLLHVALTAAVVSFGEPGGWGVTHRLRAA